MIVYDIDKEKRIIVARFKDDSNEGRGYWRTSLINMCTNILKPTYTYIPLYDVIDQCIASYTEDAFVAKAICHEDDEWNEERGKQIAKAKLLKKWNKIKQAVLWKLNNCIVDNYVETMHRLNKKLLKGE